MPNDLHIIRKMPDIQSPIFNARVYSEVFHHANVIVRAATTAIDLPEHWTPLSIKCAFGGREVYKTASSVYAVYDANYCIFNAHKVYASVIKSATPVESFTISFCADFAASTLASIFHSTAELLDNPYLRADNTVRFMETLYPHDNVVSPVLFTIYRMLHDTTTNQRALEELQYCLLEQMVIIQNRLRNEIQSVKALKHSTKLEIYQRLRRVRDYIDSCFEQDITLQHVADIAQMSPHHLLRHFQRFFHTTPHQYLTARRLDRARQELQGTTKPIWQICYDVGYNDESSFARLFKQHFTCSPQAYRSVTAPKKSIFA